MLNALPDSIYKTRLYLQTLVSSSSLPQKEVRVRSPDMISVVNRQLTIVPRERHETLAGSYRLGVLSIQCFFG